MNNRRVRALGLLLLPFMAAAPAMADELSELKSLRDTTINLLNLLVQQGVLTREKADELIRQAQEAGKQPGAGGAASGAAVAGQPAGAAAGSVAGAAGKPTAGAGATAGQPTGAGAAAPPVEPGVIRVPYIPESVKQEIRAEVKKEVLDQAHRERWGEPGALPQWLDRFTFSGDVRFRGQADRFPTDNTPNATPQLLQLPAYGAYNINNTSDPRNRLRLRARLGAEAKLGDTVTAGIRLSTGSSGTGGDPSSENENLGNYSARGTVGFDRAFISYSPWKWLNFTGGRLGNPFYAPTTMIWADDLSLQGAVLRLTPQFGAFSPFATAGVFPIQEIEPNPLNSSRSKWLFGYQGGLKWQFLPSYSLKVSGALYDYRHIEGIPNPSLVSTEFNSTAAAFRQKGNSVLDINVLSNTVNGTSNYLIGLASKFREANASATLDIAAFGTKHVLLDADYVRNLGYDHAEILARTGINLPKHTAGMQEKLTFGDTSFSSKHAWQAYIGYRRVESDAVLDAFTDSDFHLGGTDTTGYYMGGRYAFETNSTVGFRWYSAKSVDGPPLAIDVLQLDLIAAF